MEDESVEDNLLEEDNIDVFLKKNLKIRNNVFLSLISGIYCNKFVKSYYESLEVEGLRIDDPG